MSLPALIEPLVPPDTNCQGLPYMPLKVAAVLESDLLDLATPAEFRAAFILWCKSWLQVPASSIPDDDRRLAKWCSVSIEEWKSIREMALRGWVKCSDGRLYHPVIAPLAVAAFGLRRTRSAASKVRWDKEKLGDGGAAASGGENAPENAIAPEKLSKVKDKDKGKKKVTEGSSGGEVYGASAEKPPAPKADKRGSRIPPAWTASKTDLDYALAAGFDPAAIREMEDAFFDFWKAKPGQGGTKLDWPATWRTWVRTEAKRKGGRNGPGGDGQRGGGTGARGGATPREQRIGSMLKGAVDAVNRSGGR